MTVSTLAISGNTSAGPLSQNEDGLSYMIDIKNQDEYVQVGLGPSSYGVSYGPCLSAYFGFNTDTMADDVWIEPGRIIRTNNAQRAEHWWFSDMMVIKNMTTSPPQWTSKSVDLQVVSLNSGMYAVCDSDIFYNAYIGPMATGDLLKVAEYCNATDIDMRIAQMMVWVVNEGMTWEELDQLGATNAQIDQVKTELKNATGHEYPWDGSVVEDNDSMEMVLIIALAAAVVVIAVLAFMLVRKGKKV